MGRVRATDPVTSLKAAKTANVTELEAEFIAALKHTGHPMTTTEIARHWNRPRDSFSPRPRGERGLLAKRLIIPAGKRLCLNGQGKPRLMLAFALPSAPANDS
jgi:hypothetical protein